MWLKPIRPSLAKLSRLSSTMLERSRLVGVALRQPLPRPRSALALEAAGTSVRAEDRANQSLRLRRSVAAWSPRLTFTGVMRLLPCRLAHSVTLRLLPCPASVAVAVYRSSGNGSAETSRHTALQRAPAKCLRDRTLHRRERPPINFWEGWGGGGEADGSAGSTK